MTKAELAKAVKQAYQLKSESKNTEVVFNVYAKGLHVLDTEEDNIIECCNTEECAKALCESEEMKGSVYYKPIVIDSDSGTRITRKNFHHYEN
jgi:hypothetical protein